jgi:hypothetical protein
MSLRGISRCWISAPKWESKIALRYREWMGNEGSMSRRWRHMRELKDMVDEAREMVRELRTRSRALVAVGKGRG